MQENQSNANKYNKFILDDYRAFIKSKIQVIYSRKGSLTEKEVLDYCSQFDLKVSEFFTNKNQSTTSEKLRKIFGSNIHNKPAAVQINTYLLFEYGFIHCSVCKTILDKELFYSHKNTWNGYKHYCIDCQKHIRDNEHSKKYIKNNRDKYNAYLAKYRASKLQATPKWLTKEHLQEIQDIYTKAKILGMEVDHIVPLRGDNICGLHVPWNLQLLTRQQNASKSNKMS